jgi:hypothetical protein
VTEDQLANARRELEEHYKALAAAWFTLKFLSQTAGAEVDRTVAAEAIETMRNILRDNPWSVLDARVEQEYEEHLARSKAEAERMMREESLEAVAELVKCGEFERFVDENGVVTYGRPGAGS